MRTSPKSATFFFLSLPIFIATLQKNIMGISIITRAQAACMVHKTDINAENMQKCEKMLDDIPSFEICYVGNDPWWPMIVSKVRVDKFPYFYKIYPCIAPPL
jgi:hypothetical protein